MELNDPKEPLMDDNKRHPYQTPYLVLIGKVSVLTASGSVGGNETGNPDAPGQGNKRPAATP